MIFSCFSYIPNNTNRCNTKKQKTKYKINAERKSKVDDNTARMQSIKQLGV